MWGTQKTRIFSPLKFHNLHIETQRRVSPLCIEHPTKESIFSPWILPQLRPENPKKEDVFSPQYSHNDVLKSQERRCILSPQTSTTANHWHSENLKKEDIDNLEKEDIDNLEKEDIDNLEKEDIDNQKEDIENLKQEDIETLNKEDYFFCFPQKLPRPTSWKTWSICASFLAIAGWLDS